MAAQNLVVAFSGGKDSTALALELADRGHKFRLLNTPTGNELPGVREHIERVSELTGAPLIDLKAPTLGELITEWESLPNWRMRWCTRAIKIEPCQKWLREHPGTLLAVGLRADEPTREGVAYGGESATTMPLREWGWGVDRVKAKCARAGLTPPKRTDCAVCFYQTLSEWWTLWSEHPDFYAEGERWEALAGHTFRSPQRDAWPAGLTELRHEFERGRKPVPRVRKVMCRVCKL